MRHATRWMPFGIVFACMTLVLWLAGCGANSTGGSGYGADAPPWTNPPERRTSTSATRPSTDTSPTAPLHIVLRGTAPEGGKLFLTPVKIELKASGGWYPVTNAAGMQQLDALPAPFTVKGGATLLFDGRIPARKYSHVRLQFDDAAGKTCYIHEETSRPLVIQNTTLGLGEWTPAEKGANALTLTVDGAKLTMAADSATLPAEGLIAAVQAPTGGVTGKLVPGMPNAKITLYWGGSKHILGTAVPQAQTGDFSIEHLPAGSYRLEVSAPGHKLVAPLKDPVVIAEKIVTLTPLELATDNRD